MKISKFKIDRNLNPKQNSEIIIKYVKSVLSKSELSANFKLLFNIINVPEKILIEESKHFFQFNFNNSNGKYNKKFRLLFLPLSFLKYFLFFLWIIIFRNTKKIDQKTYELIIDDIEHLSTLKTFDKFSNFFSSVLIIGSQNFKEKLNIKSDFFFFNNYKNLYLNLNFSFFINFFLKIPIFLIFYSLKVKANLFELNLHILKKFFKYQSLFNIQISKYLLHERFYRTSSLRNFLFKKYGGKTVSVTQRVLPLYSSFGMFVVADNLLTLGEKSAEIIKRQDSNVTKFVAVGSMSYKENLIDKTTLDKPLSYDLLDLESQMSDFNDLYENFYNDWYTKYEWLAEFSNKYPHYKIGIKIRPEHNSIKLNKNIIDIIKNTKINLIDGSEYNFKFNTYHYAKEAKSLCTWISTMGFEMIGHNNPCIFMNPGKRNCSFDDDEIFNEINANDYSDFEKKILNIINNKSKIKSLNLNNFCHNSEDIFSKISQILKS